jgi:hypothetical protein
VKKINKKKLMENFQTIHHTIQNMNSIFEMKDNHLTLKYDFLPVE